MRRSSCARRRDVRWSNPRLRTLPWAVLSLLLVLVSLALAQSPSGGSSRAGGEDPKRTGAPEAPTPIPVAEIAQRAEEVSEFLRAVDAAVAPSARVASIESNFPGLAERITTRTTQTRAALAAQPTLGTLDTLTDTWQSTRLTLSAWVEELTARAIKLDEQRARLAALKETWTHTRAEARSAGAPAPIVERIDAVLGELDTARARVEKARSATLLLQDRVAREVMRCEEALVELAAARRQAAGELFERDSPPLWRVRPNPVGEAMAELGDGLRSQCVALWQLFEDEYSHIILHAAVVLGLMVAFSVARRRGRRRSPEAPAASFSPLLEHPVAGALVLGFLASFWIYSGGPRTARAFVEIGTLVPLVLILRGLVPPPVRPGLYALATFFLVDRLRELIVTLTLVERYVFLLEMLAAAVVLSWFIRTGRARNLIDEVGPATGRAVRVALALGLAGFILAFGSAFFGNMSLARLVASGIFASGYLALLLEGGRQLANGIVSFALRVRPLRLLNMVTHHRPLLERRAHAILHVLAVVAWVVGTLDYFGLYAPIWDAARRILGAELTRGALRISLGDVIAFAVTVWVSFLVSALVRFVLDEDVFPRINLRPGLPYALSTFVRYALVCVGFVLALLVLGVNLDRVTVLGGALGVGVGFGLQNIVNNFVSGLIVLFERPVRVGDAVQIGDVQGEVRRIGIRSSTVAAWEGAEVIVPNSMLVAEKVTNWTPAAHRRRIDIQMNVAYGTAPEGVLKLLADVGGAHPDVAAQPPPQALFLGFGDSALRYELRVWTSRLDRHSAVKSELGVALYAALRGAGMSIPLPQQEVRIYHEPPDALLPERPAAPPS